MLERPLRRVMSVRRVALVSPYALSVFGGVQEQVLAMSRVLGARGRDVLIVAPDAHDDDALRHARQSGAPRAVAGRCPLTDRERRSLFRLWPRHGLAPRSRLFAPDVVHFHEPFAPLFWVVGVMGSRAPRASPRSTAVATGRRSAFTRPVLERPRDASSTWRCRSASRQPPTIRSGRGH